MPVMLLFSPHLESGVISTNGLGLPYQLALLALTLKIVNSLSVIESERQ
ncbi:MAG: hypothetical protein ACJAY2_003539 [Pseudomonadales bacterium]|jgi:hypothetical protein